VQSNPWEMWNEFWNWKRCTWQPSVCALPRKEYGSNRIGFGILWLQLVGSTVTCLPHSLYAPPEVPEIYMSCSHGISMEVLKRVQAYENLIIQQLHSWELLLQNLWFDCTVGAGDHHHHHQALSRVDSRYP